MRTKDIFRMKGEVLREKKKTGLSPQPPRSFPSDHSKVNSLLQFFSVCAPVVSYVEFVLLFVPHLSLFWYLEKAVHLNCGLSWVSSLISMS